MERRPCIFRKTFVIYSAVNGSLNFFDADRASPSSKAFMPKL